jgi:hypothetical protein
MVVHFTGRGTGRREGRPLMDDIGHPALGLAIPLVIAIGTSSRPSRASFASRCPNLSGR